MRALPRAALSERLGRSGCERCHSATSATSTPSAVASARTAMMSACWPLFQAAYAILTAEADVSSPGNTTASSGPVVNSAATRAAAGPDR